MPKFEERFDAWYGMDTENLPGKDGRRGRVNLVALVSESGATKIWKKPGGFAAWCEKQTGDPVVICHNLEYDLINEFGDRYADLQLVYLRGRLISAKCGAVNFLDSFNHFRMPLWKIGEAIGYKKLDYDPESVEYVKRDALIPVLAMTRARDFIANLGGRIGGTAGSSATSVWRAMTQDAYLIGPIDSQFHRDAYYGGRVELFRTHAQGDIRGYDINSMYPYAMLGEFPEYLVEDKGMKAAKGIARATVRVPEGLRVAPLPYRTEKGRLLYPVGKFTGTWTYDELRYAENHGAKILKIHAAVGGSVLCSPFREFIETLYKMRLECKDPSESLFIKTIMNSLYGKLASRCEITRVVSRYKLTVNNDPRIKDVLWITDQRGLLTYQTPPQNYVIVPWGAYITSYARIVLNCYLNSIDPDSLIYCDTDSMYCMNQRVEESKDLGGMKLEKQARIMRVVQPKAYQLDDFFKAKGVPKPEKNKKGELVIDYAREYIENGIASFSQPVRFRESLRRKGNLEPNSWIEKSRRRVTAYANKTFSNGIYYPPKLGGGE